MMVMMMMMMMIGDDDDNGGGGDNGLEMHQSTSSYHTKNLDEFKVYITQ